MAGEQEQVQVTPSQKISPMSGSSDRVSTIAGEVEANKAASEKHEVDNPQLQNEPAPPDFPEGGWKGWATVVGS